MTRAILRALSSPAAAVLLAILFLALHARHLDFIVDDTFIPLRYAENLLDGRGLVFNHNERVEGYTDFLWVLLSSAAFALPVEPAAAVRALSFAAGAALLALIPGLYRRTFPETRRFGTLPPLLLALSTPYAIWSSAGLETSLFTLFVTAGVLLCLHDGPALPPAGAALLAACLTRPEGHLYAALALAAVLVRRRRKGDPLVDGPLAVTVAAAVSLLAAYHGWRLWYYGGLLPNTFAAKVGATGEQAARGLRYAGGFFADGGGPLLLLPLLLLRRRATRSRSLLPLACISATLLYVILVGGDSMLAYRFIVPVLPLWHVLVVGAIAEVSKGAARPVSSPVLVCSAAALLGLWSFRGWDGDTMAEVRRRSTAVRAWEEVGRWMRMNLDGESHIALGAVGAIPFYTRFRTTDLFGLTDPVIARTPAAGMGSDLAGHERSNVSRVLSRRPDYILSYVVLTDRPLDGSELRWLFRGSRAERELWDSPEVHRRYEPRSFDLGPGFLNVLALREGAAGGSP